jgi:hypothetical protein
VIELAGYVLIAVLAGVVLTGVSAGVWVGARLHRDVVAIEAPERKQLSEHTVLAELGELRLLHFSELSSSKWADMRYHIRVQEKERSRKRCLWVTREYIGNNVWYRADTGEGASSSMDRRLNALLAQYKNRQRIGEAMKNSNGFTVTELIIFIAMIAFSGVGIYALYLIIMALRKYVGS